MATSHNNQTPLCVVHIFLISAHFIIIIIYILGCKHLILRILLVVITCMNLCFFNPIFYFFRHSSQSDSQHGRVLPTDAAPVPSSHRLGALRSHPAGGAHATLPDARVGAHTAAGR